MQQIDYDEGGNIQGGSFMDYLVPTAVETRHWETDKTVTPSPHHSWKVWQILKEKGIAD